MIFGVGFVVHSKNQMDDHNLKESKRSNGFIEGIFMKVGVDILNKRHNKGFTLVEMIIVLAIVAMILPLVLELFAFGQETFVYQNRLIAQQYAVTNVMQHIRGDVQSAGLVLVVDEPHNTEPEDIDEYPKVYTLKLGYYSDGSNTIDEYRYWKFFDNGDGGKLRYSGVTTESNASALGVDDYSDVVTGLDITKCKFDRSTSYPDKLIVEIKPFETNSGRAQARNVKEKISTEISVLYKK